MVIDSAATATGATMPTLKHATSPLLDKEAAIARRERELRRIEILLTLSLDASRRARLMSEMISLAAQIAHLNKPAPSRGGRMTFDEESGISEWLLRAIERNTPFTD
jgi:hypothetical protein